MKFLLIDNSNSYTKFALSTRDKLLEWKTSIPTAELSAIRIKQELPTEKVDGTIISSVTESNLPLLRRLAPSRLHVVHYSSLLGLKIDYPKPQEIGIDRLVNAVAAQTLYGGSCLIVDCGTAVTFDVLKQPNIYQGGVIAPGINSFTNYLNQCTDHLPLITPVNHPFMIGKTTKEAMQIGCNVGYTGMLEKIISQMASNFESEHRLIVTGGDGKYLDHLNPYYHCPRLTLEGLRIIAKRIFTA